MRTQEHTTPVLETDRAAQGDNRENGQAEQLLLNSEEETYRRFFEVVPMGIGVWDQAEHLLWANPGMESITGYTLEELRTVGIDALYPHPMLRHDLLEVLWKSGRVRDWEVRLKRKDGTTYDATLSMEHIEVGGRKLLLTMMRSVTKRKQIAETLRESAERFRLITETIDEVFWISDVENEKMIYISPAYERVWGYSRKNLYHNQKSFRDAIHPEDRERVVATFAMEKTGQPFEQEYRIIRSDGSIRNIWDRGFPVPDETGRVKRYVGVAQDVTAWRSAEEALKESKDYLNQIINCIGDTIFVKDQRHQHVLVNDAMCTWTGKRREELLGKTAHELFAKAEMDPLLEQEKLVFETGKECITEDQITDPQGNKRTLMTKKSLLLDGEGNKQIVGVGRDITELKHAEKEREKLLEQLRQSQKMEAVGVLAGGVAHDFNNLLSVIKGYTELLLEDLAPDDPKRLDLERIEKAGQQAAVLVSQLLAFSRKQMLNPVMLNLDDVIAEMSQMLHRLISEDIELAFVTRSAPGLVKADQGQIQQIIMNLVVNARDAMPQGGTITIETANMDLDEDYARKHPTVSAGQYVMLAISDTGIGMDEATQARIFEPFFTTKEKGKGTGLGLSTVYGIVNQSNGFIWVYSELGKGTTFKIYLPRVQGEAASFSVDDSVVSNLRGSETVLVVEDEPSVRALAVRILRERGYTVIEASNGKEALRAAQEYAGKIDLVLTDVIMPEMNGKVLVSQIEAERPGIRTLFVSGYADNAIVHQGILEPNVAFLQKPFAGNALASKVREVLDAPQAREENA
jgi:PAS domain S-box-containing protein